MKWITSFLGLTLLISLQSEAATSPKPVAPFVNPFLADSTYPAAHAQADFTPLAGPTAKSGGGSRRLHADEIKWTPVGPGNNWAPVYSGPYPNGKRVIWVGGYDRVAKLDAETLEVLTTYAIGGNTYFGDAEIRRHIKTLDELDDGGMVAYNLRLWAEPFKSVESFYRLLSRDNELYLSHRGKNGVVSLQVYGEADPADPASEISLKREWKIPPEISQATIFSMNMTPDGWVVMVTSDGSLIVISRDLKTHTFIKLPQQPIENKAKTNQDVFSTFVRNGITIDDQGGIYLVTRDNMHRVQWTGSKLSLEESDGAWRAPYPNEQGNGSGTTPGLIGWGPDEDHLVAIADGTKGNKMVVFWRDKIPADWKGLPGLDRRIAGITPIRFGVSKDERVQIENTPIIYGYGAFFDTIFPVKRLPDQGGPARQWLAEVFSAHIPGQEMLGGAMIRWDPKARELKTAWQSQANFVAAVCTISGATELLYCWGARNREWTLEGVDWHSGKSAFHYTLGKSQRFSPLGGSITIAPNGAVDCGCAGGMGTVRVKPRTKH